MTAKELWIWLRREDVVRWLKRADVRASFAAAAKGRVWLVPAAFLWAASGWGGVVAAEHAPPSLLQAVGALPAAAAWEAQMARNDPRPGSLCRLPALYRLDGSPVLLPRRGHPTCLLFVYQCEQCQTVKKLYSLNGWAREVPTTYCAAVIVRGQPADVRDYWRRNGLSVPVVLDRSGLAARELNAFLQTRFYLFDAEGRLRWCSSSADNRYTVEGRLRKSAAGIF